MNHANPHAHANPGADANPGAHPIQPRPGVHVASDGYPLHLLRWTPPADAFPVPIARAVVLHGVQSHADWYHNLGRRLAEHGIEAWFPDRRGSGSNTRERGHAPHSKRLLDDVAEILRNLRAAPPTDVPLLLAGISWGGKLVVAAAARNPELMDQIALLCPGLQPRVGVPPGERLRVALAFLLRPRKTFPIPLSEPELFTDNPAWHPFIRDDPKLLREGTAKLLAASAFLDRMVRKAPPRVAHPVLLMLAGRDRIIDNERTRAYFRTLATPESRKTLIEYPEAGHTLEFEPDPNRYALDLVQWWRSQWNSNPTG